MKRSTMAFSEIFRISDEMLVSEIFMRLPASCVVTLRSVCRSWRRLTTEPSFVRAHVRRARLADADPVSPEPIVYRLNTPARKPGELHLLKLDARDVDNVVGTFKIRAISGSGPTLRLVASCDGLLCFQPPEDFSEDDEDLQKPCYVCNPVTRIWTTVAASARAAVSEDQVNSCYRCLLGFYFHRSTGEYRLLHYWGSYVADQEPLWFEGAYEVATVGGEDKSWRSVRNLRLTGDRVYEAAENYDAAEVLALFGDRLHGSITVNGSLHWLHSVASNKMGVVAFDTESEKFSRISAPICPDKVQCSDVRMSKIRGNLCLGWIMRNSYGELMMDLWMLKDYAKQQWAKLHTIRPDGRGFMRTVRPREGVDDAEGDGEMMVWWYAKRFAIYNFKLKTYKQIPITYSDLLEVSDIYDGNKVIFYRESLVDPRTNLL